MNINNDFIESSNENINRYFIWKKSKNLHPHKTHSH